ncbi:MAG TPA: hypothetical protein VK961_26800 [Chthoniobacter sp.]|nr:hypothetical protein [Chthoniobacter sp.]
MDSIDSESFHGTKLHFTLEPEFVSIQDADGRLEQRVPYWSIWPTYHVHSLRRENRTAKMLIWSMIPATLIYWGVQAGWLLFVLAAITALPIFFWLRTLTLPPRKEVTFRDDEDGSCLFSIIYPESKEEKAMQFVRALTERLELFSARRIAERNSPDQNENDE